MGQQTSAPINEAVHLLKKNAPGELQKVRADFPQLSRELAGGLEGGESSDNLDLDRGLVMIRALNVATKKARNELASVRQRMSASKTHRLWAQIVTLFGGSGVLAGLAIDQPKLTLATAILTLISSLGNLLADRMETLVQPGSGNIYEAHDRASSAAYKAELLSAELELLVKHKADKEELSQAVAAANALCEELNKWIAAMEGGRPTKEWQTAPSIGSN